MVTALEAPLLITDGASLWADLILRQNVGQQNGLLQSSLHAGRTVRHRLQLERRLHTTTHTRASTFGAFAFQMASTHTSDLAIHVTQSDRRYFNTYPSAPSLSTVRASPHRTRVFFIRFNCGTRDQNLKNIEENRFGARPVEGEVFDAARRGGRTCISQFDIRSQRDQGQGALLRTETLQRHCDRWTARVSDDRPNKERIAFTKEMQGATARGG